MVTPDERSDAQLIEARMNSYQPEDQPESMDYEESVPMICSSPILETSLRIKEFLQQRIHIDDQSTRLWYRNDEHDNIRDTLIIEQGKMKLTTCSSKSRITSTRPPCQI